MVSLEQDPNIFARASYNKPFSCIHLIDKTSGDFITDYSPDSPTIFWLDYSDSNTVNEQMNEVASLAAKVLPGDIVRVSFNAHPRAIFNEKELIDSQPATRLTNLITNFDLEEPVQFTEEDVKSKHFASTLLKILNSKISEDNLAELLPISSTSYADGQKMVTITFVAISTEIDENNQYGDKNIYFALRYNRYFNQWMELSTKPSSIASQIIDNPLVINVPELTVQEMLLINKIAPGQNKYENTAEILKHQMETQKDEGNQPSSGISLEQMRIIQTLGTQEVSNYLRYYQIYPDFHNVSI